MENTFSVIPQGKPTLIVLSSLCMSRGLLQLENITYGIEPLESSATFEHMIYQIKNNKIDYSPLKENINRQHESPSYRILVNPEVSLAFVCATHMEILRLDTLGQQR